MTAIAVVGKQDASPQRAGNVLTRKIGTSIAIGCMEATVMIRTTHLWFFVLLAGASLAYSGCASLEDHEYYSKNRSRAAAAWKATRVNLPEDYVNRDFGRGFKAGYYAVCTGGSTSPPVAPPPSYWAARYQSPTGQQAVNLWYQGFQRGVIEGEREGRHLWSKVPTADGPGMQNYVSDVPEVMYATDTISEPIATE